MAARIRAYTGMTHDDEFGGRTVRSRGHRAAWRLVTVPMLATMAALALAPLSSADPTTDLRSQVAAKRGNCPALQADPVLDSVAQRANLETQNYTNHTARYVPMEDPMPMLQSLGYPAGKAKLLAGFAGTDKSDPQQSAEYGAVLFGSETIPDCSFTRYGADVVSDPNTGNATAAIVLAGN